MAFSEACLLACFLDRPLHFLVRGDVFKPKYVWFFNQTNQIPIYRFRDGFSNMRRNAESFALAHQALKEEKAILIFAEGNTKLQKKLSPLQKGTARLAFGAYQDKGAENIQIVPVGVNYSCGTQFRSDVQIKVGTPIKLADYLAIYEEDHHHALRKVTEDLYDRMLPLVIHIEDPEDEPLANRLFSIYGKTSDEPSWPILDSASVRFEREKRIANRINQLSTDQKADMLRIASAIPAGKAKRVDLKKGLILAIGLPIALLGFILNAVPFYVPKYIAEKKVKQVEFYSPVRMGLMIGLYVMWFGLSFLLAVYFIGWYAFLAIWILPLSGFVTVLWKDGLNQLIVFSGPTDSEITRLNQLLSM